MTKKKMTDKEKTIDYFVTRLQMLRVRWTENIKEIDDICDELFKRIK